MFSLKNIIVGASLALGLIFPTVLNAENYLGSQEFQTYKSKFMKPEWVCSNPKSNFPGFGEGFLAVAIFTDPFQKITHLYVVDTSTGIEFDVKNFLTDDNSKVVHMCINGMGLLMVNKDMINNMKKIPLPDESTNSSKPSTDDNHL